MQESSILTPNPFFKNLQDETKYGKFAQFYFAVEYWVQHLQRLAKLLSPNEASILQENIDDELDVKHEGLEAHTVTFKQFLRDINVAIPEQNTSLAVQEFITNLKGLFDRPLGFHTACLAGIESSYISISDYIAKNVITHGGQLHHYKLHKALDVKHSADLEKISKTLCSTEIEFYVGFGHGIILLDKLYENLAIETS